MLTRDAFRTDRVLSLSPMPETSIKLKDKGFETELLSKSERSNNKVKPPQRRADGLLESRHFLPLFSGKLDS